MTIRGIPYSRVRWLLTGVGLIILSLIALLMYVRSVDAIEVLGTLFFLPVFLGMMFWGWRGGVIVGLLAAFGYAAMRYPAIAAVGVGRFAGLILGRAAGYLAFGAVGGWAADQLRASIDKLGLYDQVDDATGLLNARALLQIIDMENSRSRRYEKVFSVVAVAFPASVFDGVPRRRRDTTLRQLGKDLAASIRAADRAGHVLEDDRHVIVVVLPETGRQGASAFAHNLEERLAEELAGPATGPVREVLETAAITVPEDTIDPLEARLRAITDQEFPERNR